MQQRNAKRQEREAEREAEEREAEEARMQQADASMKAYLEQVDDGYVTCFKFVWAYVRSACLAAKLEPQFLASYREDDPDYSEERNMLPYLEHLATAKGEPWLRELALTIGIPQATIVAKNVEMTFSAIADLLEEQYALAPPKVAPRSAFFQFFC